MASNPPFQLEDTDEDFFDKLVEDDVEPVKSNHNEGNDSDDARAFANLGITDVDAAFEDSLGGESGIEVKGEMGSEKFDSSLIGSHAEEGNSMMSSSVGCESSTMDPGNDGMGTESRSASTVTNSNGIISSEVKEVGWNSFYADSNGGVGFGSYSDFFSELGDQSGDFPGKAGDNFNREVNPGNEVQGDSVNASFNHAQYLEGEHYDASLENSTNEQDLNSIQYWESQGWRYDSNTGQWYQIDGYNGTAANQESSEANATVDWNAVSDGQAEVSYMQQTSQSVAGTLAETGTTEIVSNWGQVAQGDNGYPEHMYFDPQYPEWYFDKISQEWRLLATYNSSSQSIAQGLENGYASTSAFSHNDDSFHRDYAQAGSYGSQDVGGQAVEGTWNDQQNTSSSFGVAFYNKASPSPGLANGTVELAQGFVPGGDAGQRFNYSNTKLDEPKQFSNDYTGSQKSISYSQPSLQGANQFTYAPHVGRSSAGRPPHALVTFGFGGKLIVMKDSSLLSSSYGTQDTLQGSVSVLNLMEVVVANVDSSHVGNGASDYFSALCQQSFPGPMVGGSVGSKELYKWLDERIAHCGSPDMDIKKGERLRLLLSLLKIACQHYGKLRSPFGADTMLKENDTPESAVAKLFASAKMSGAQFTQYGVLSHCLQNLPSEGQLRATAFEVQNLLVSGKKKEALQYAQEGQLWGPALVLAAQLGEQFYVDTVKQMAVRQLIMGSPLRTLCLLIAGQPAEVFSTDSSISGQPGAVNMSQQPAQFGNNGMLDDWEENLAVITANRTKDDELVIIHLGDCLWKERSENTAAHICYLVAEANFEPYSDSARLCLIGADHWKFPRTFASPDAIQRTELYEYSKVLGNSQFVLLPFQPYKLIYAYMLAEVGRVSDSLKYCQAVLKSLKTGRAPEVETWKQLVLSLEERIKTHQQGGYAANLAPGKLVGKLLNLIDSTAHRVVGGLPPPAPATSHGNIQGNEHHYQPMAPRVPNSQSTMAMSSLVPSASMEPISEWTADGNRMTAHNRSVSEPDFGRTPRQVDSSQETTSSDAQGKASASGGTSRLSRFGFGSQLFQKTVGLVLRPRPGRQAKLGEKNKFYYDEKLKRWVEEGAEPPAEEAALAPPPTGAAFQNGKTEYNLKSALKTESSPSNEVPAFRTSSPPEHTSGIPPIPPSSNQFSARGRMGVRSRYVDTFNQGGGNSANLFQSPSAPSVKPAVNAKFFIPAPVPSSNEQTMEAIAESTQEGNAANEGPSTSANNDPFQSHKPSSSTPIQRYPSMGNIPSKGVVTNSSASLSSLSRRTASWSGSFSDSFSPPNMGEIQPLGEALGIPPSTFIPDESSSLTHTPMKSRNFGEDLHEVEL
ncbi:hypothetical protein L6164_028085 [Bauhinia variegata]|uniref:Uncharacterized protein n=1 Tax=Bauhinia variegata TaxID=167791 RepID=A0ACB9LV42_BAUVA|nr:hypothetical protein L6164_028085 [Bauhinia variegata]